MKASDINRAIAAKYSGDEWRVWFEVSQSTGHFSGRRADAVVMNIWPSKDFQLHVFEVKVSRSDFKNETADLSKWQAVGQYADFFWMACPAGLVRPDEVPEAWGLIELTKSGLRVKKQAPARSDPTPIDRGFAASLLRSGQDLTQAEIDNRVREGVESGRASIEERAAVKMRGELSLIEAAHQKTKDWMVEFEAAYGCKPNEYCPPSDMAARINLASQIERNSFDGIARQAKQLAALIEAIKPPTHSR